MRIFTFWEMVLAMVFTVGITYWACQLEPKQEQPTAVKRDAVPAGAVTLGGAGGVIVHRLPDRVFNNICYVTNAGELSCVNNPYNKTTLE